MKKDKKVYHRMGYKLLLKDNEGKFVQSGMAMYSRHLVHELVKKNYPGRDFRIEGIRLDGTPIKRPEKKESSNEKRTQFDTKVS